MASLSHDLKTPITGIKLTTELLKAKLEAADERYENTGDIKEKLDKLLKAFNIGEGAVHSVKLLGKFTVWIAGICTAVYGLYISIMDNIMK